MSAVPARLAGRPIVDGHVHAFPPRVFAAIWRWFDEHAWTIATRRPALEAARILLDGGVERVVVLHYAHVAGMAAALNRFAAELAREEPRIVACATVMPGEPGARAILDEALGRLGCRGIKIHCHVQRVAADDPRLDDVYDAGRVHGVPVVIHAGDAPALPTEAEDLAALCATASLERALTRHPGTTVIVPHLGASRLGEVAALLDRHENLYLDTTMTLARFLPFDARTRATDAAAAGPFFEQAAAIVRAWPGRILYGTDFPNLPYEWTRELEAIDALDLPAPVLDALLAGTARRLFGIPSS